MKNVKNAEKYCPRFSRFRVFDLALMTASRLVGRLVENPNLGTGDDSNSENIQ